MINKRQAADGGRARMEETRMETLLWNDGWVLAVPQGFHVMDEKEREEIRFLGGVQGECLSDPERHILFSVAWKRIGGFAALILSEKDIAKAMEFRIREPMEAYGYIPEGFSGRLIGGKKAFCFRYAYEVEGVAMRGESMAFKDGKTVWYVHFYYRQEMEAESRPVAEEMLASLRPAEKRDA